MKPTAMKFSGWNPEGSYVLEYEIQSRNFLKILKEDHHVSIRNQPKNQSWQGYREQLILSMLFAINKEDSQADIINYISSIYIDYDGWLQVTISTFGLSDDLSFPKWSSTTLRKALWLHFSNFRKPCSQLSLADESERSKTLRLLALRFNTESAQSWISRTCKTMFMLLSNIYDISHLQMKEVPWKRRPASRKEIRSNWRINNFICHFAKRRGILIYCMKNRNKYSLTSVIIQSVNIDYKLHIAGHL